jgi:hypothetical protein
MSPVIRMVSAAVLAAALTLCHLGSAAGADLPPLGRLKPKPKCCRCKPAKPPTCDQLARRLEPLPNAIESTVIVTYGRAKPCFLPEKLPIVIKVGEELPVNIRHVYHDGLFVPLSGRDLRLSIIDSFGSRMPSRALSADRVRTRFDGFANQPIRFSSPEIGVFRLRVDFLDRDVWSFVLSPNIIVSSR